MMLEILDNKSDNESMAQKAIKALTELSHSEPVYRTIIDRITQ